jgi:hypothetical protein
LWHDESMPRRVVESALVRSESSLRERRLGIARTGRLAGILYLGAVAMLLIAFAAAGWRSGVHGARALAGALPVLGAFLVAAGHLLRHPARHRPAELEIRHCQ